MSKQTWNEVIVFNHFIGRGFTWIQMYRIVFRSDDQSDLEIQKDSIQTRGHPSFPDGGDST